VAHGINPQEAPAYFREVERLTLYPNIKMAVLTFGDNVLGRTYPNMFCLRPPVYSPRDVKPRMVIAKPDVLRLGFFGQYRKEKNLEAFLETFLACRFTRKVELFVQGATVSPADTEDFDRIIAKYSGVKELAFLHKGLAGREWQETINGIDALIMPYSAQRYLYHWSAMLFTAIGYYKPAVLSAEINPEVLAQFEIGQVFHNGIKGSLQQALENFVNSFDDKRYLYQTQLDQANTAYSPRRFVEQLVALSRSAKP
jgi:glycosyltransferase involved in cell wall biosynthesis